MSNPPPPKPERPTIAEDIGNGFGWLKKLATAVMTEDKESLLEQAGAFLNTFKVQPEEASQAVAKVRALRAVPPATEPAPRNEELPFESEEPPQ